jgi:PKHD-type hydroxylase
MFIVIADVLSAIELEALVQHLSSNAGGFESGKNTAGVFARAVKENEQLNSRHSDTVLGKVEGVLLANPVFKAAALPKSLVKMLVSRYRPGMAYGTHVDEPIMLGVRTDLSFTLFLSEPSAYEGGELVIEQHDGDRNFKLGAGSLILYPSNALHRVTAVERGERLAVVGWVRSLIRDDQQREVLFDLANVIATPNADRSVLNSLHKVRANLMRMWADD